MTTENIAAIAVLGIVGTGFAYVLNYQIITSDGATVASTVTYLLPVVAIVLGVLGPQRACHGDHTYRYRTGSGWDRPDTSTDEVS